MRFKLGEIEILKGDPFKNCKLGRAKYADILTKVVQHYTEGCVLAIDGSWGCGKTTFIKMWKQSLMDEGFSTLYFNVWQDDFISDPLVGLLGQLKTLKKSDKNNATFENILKFGAGIANCLTNGAITTYADGLDLCNGSMSQDVEDYINKQESLKKFKESIVSYIDDCVRNENDQTAFKPVIFFIDELDRCCPSYAVKVLERIKHLFDIPNLIFVLSIDKIQLINSVRGYYGSESIDANEYLRRFIDFEYKLPEPNIHDFCNYLYDIFLFDKFFNIPGRHAFFGNRNEKEEFLTMSVIIFKDLHYNLRQMEKTYAHIRLILTTFSNNNHVIPGLMITLLYLRDKHSSLYNRIYKKEIALEDLISFFEKTFSRRLLNTNAINTQPRRHIIWNIAQFIVCYKFDELIGSELSLIDNDNNLLFHCNAVYEEEMKEAINWFVRNLRSVNSSNGSFSLNYLYEHIELLQDIRQPLF